MFWRIAWRNLARNRKRSFVMALTVSVAVVGLMMTRALTHAMADQMLESTLQYQSQHISIAVKDYHQNPTAQKCFSLGPELMEALNRQENIEIWVPRVSFQGMAQSPENSAPVQVIGVDPKAEKGFSPIPEFVVKGEYLDNEPGIFIGQELADHLDLGLGEKMVIMCNDRHGDLQSTAIRVSGIFKTPFKQVNKMVVHMPLGQAQDLLDYANEINEIGVKCTNLKVVQSVQSELSKASKNDVVILAWQDRNPLLVYMLEMFNYNVLIFGLILFVAVLFSIINLFLMIILERTREMGILMAMGAAPRMLRRLLYLEITFLSLLGCLLGSAISFLIIGTYHHVGLDLSAVSEGLAVFGVNSVIYPYVTVKDSLWINFASLAVALIAAVYPAHKATNHWVVNALHHQ